MDSNEFFYDNQFDDYTGFQRGRKLTFKFVCSDLKVPIVNLEVKIPSSIKKYTDSKGYIKIVVPENLSRITFFADQYETKELKLSKRKSFYKIKLNKIYYKECEVDQTNMMSVYKYGLWIFNDKDIFKNYLNSRPRALAYRQPKELNSIQLYEALSRMIHGVYV